MNTLLRLLQDGRFHSGQELGDALGVSRSSIWKQLQRLEAEYGLALHRVSGRGYRLAEPLSMLDPVLLRNGLVRLGMSFRLHDVLDSTNAECLRLVQAGESVPLVVMTETQLKGRGRRGRHWVSPLGQNLYFSMAVKVRGGAQRLGGMSLVVGLAVLAALRHYGIDTAGVKWPNDIYVEGKKIAGILLELMGDPQDLCHVVIGIGINVNMTAYPENIGQPWTSMRIESGRMIDRNALSLTLGECLDAYLQRHFIEGFEGMRDEWEANHVWQGQYCTLTAGARAISGVVMGVSADGALRMLVDGREQAWCAGELSLRLAHDT